LWVLAEKLLPEDDIEAYTQGLMDLGATLCTRSRPDCPACPLTVTCVARRETRQQFLPTPRPRKTIPERSTVFFIISDGHGVLLARPVESGVVCWCRRKAMARPH
ncbi:MAG TPA: hypothetical protein PLW86_15400, partial [Rhodocyclaceae bacterium]|nr:hypothetical protein [Rhodocyclaceae bacterium]